MKKMLFVTLAIVLCAGVASAATVVGSAHDMTTHSITGMVTNQVCVFCHTPHMSASANQQVPLWNHTASAHTASYGSYTSPTLNASISGLDPTVGMGSLSVSMLCMSCHDGTSGVNVLYKQPLDGSAGNATLIGAIGTGSADLGTTLTDDHPVNFVYDSALATADGGLTTPADASSVDGVLPLYTGTMQCASCHNVHDPSNTPFLRATNAASGLCLRCHVK